MVWPAIIGAAAAIGGGLLSGDSSRKIAHEQMDAQREFAQMGIRWKVADAKAAGIHPLYALGASTHSFSPVSVGGPDWGGILGQAGQDISRAYSSTRTQQERQDLGAFALAQERASDLRVAQRRAFELDTIGKQHQIMGQSIQNDNAMLQNELLRMRIASQARSAQLGPGMPNWLTDDTPVKLKQSEQIAAGDAPSTEAALGRGKPAMVPYAIGGKRMGWTIDVPSSEFGEGLEGGGPASWLLGAAGIGGHYLGKAADWFTDEYGGRELQARVYRYLQNRGVYPRRKGM